MALPWILYAEPGKRQLEAFANGLRYNLTEIAPGCVGILIRRMDDVKAEHRDVASSLDEAKAKAEAVQAASVTRKGQQAPRPAPTPRRPARWRP